MEIIPEKKLLRFAPFVFEGKKKRPTENIILPFFARLEDRNTSNADEFRGWIDGRPLR